MFCWLAALRRAGLVVHVRPRARGTVGAVQPTALVQILARRRIVIDVGTHTLFHGVKQHVTREMWMEEATYPMTVMRSQSA